MIGWAITFSVFSLCAAILNGFAEATFSQRLAWLLFTTLSAGFVAGAILRSRS